MVWLVGRHERRVEANTGRGHERCIKGNRSAALSIRPTVQPSKLVLECGTLGTRTLDFGTRCFLNLACNGHGRLTRSIADLRQCVYCVFVCVCIVCIVCVPDHRCIFRWFHRCVCMCVCVYCMFVCGVLCVSQIINAYSAAFTTVCVCVCVYVCMCVCIVCVPDHQ